MAKYDMVIYGASGFTGQFVIEYVHRAAKEHQLSWAVAGRHEGRLRAALARAGAVVGADLGKVPVIICDSADSRSLMEMAQQAKVVLNCVGPYRLVLTFPSLIPYFLPLGSLERLWWRLV